MKAERQMGEKRSFQMPGEKLQTSNLHRDIYDIGCTACNQTVSWNKCVVCV